MGTKTIAATLGLLFALAACDNKGGIPGYDALSRQVERMKVGGGPDHWIEMKNLSGNWERTGLIFGYADDYDECLKAIAGLKKVNYAREYRCMRAN